jgi:hypothetical protein
MSASFVKFNDFVHALATKTHNLNSDLLMILLTNTVPNAADTVVDTTTTTCTVKSTSNALEIAAGNGYTKGGNAAAFSSGNDTTGTYKLILTSPTAWTATGGTIGPFEYAVIYNNSSGSTSTRGVIGWWDYGSAVTLQSGETFTVTLDGTNGVLTLA